jgi:hypothetical protein
MLKIRTSRLSFSFLVLICLSSCLSLLLSNAILQANHDMLF